MKVIVTCLEAHINFFTCNCWCAEKDCVRVKCPRTNRGVG